MTDLRIGYDMDGVFADIKNIYQPGDRTDDYRNAKPLKACSIPGMWPIIITGRREKYREVTMEWLSKHITYQHGINELIMMPDGEPTEEKEPFAQFKADVIHKRGIEIYIDDDVWLVDRLQTLCPRTLILHYRK